MSEVFEHPEDIYDVNKAQRSRTAMQRSASPMTSREQRQSVRPYCKPDLLTRADTCLYMLRTDYLFCSFPKAESTFTDSTRIVACTKTIWEDCLRKEVLDSTDFALLLEIALAFAESA